MTLATRLFHRAARFSTSIMPKAVLVNAGRLDYDRKLDFSRLERACGAPLTRHDDDTPSPSDIAARAVGHGILITKEVPVDVDALPDGVRLICEAGTGFNNVDLDAAARRGITVCNVPTYSTDAVAHLVITYVLNFSSSVVPRARALARGDTSAFTSFTALGAYPHFELQGKTIGLVGGTGAIGAKVAEIARIFGMRVLVWSRSARTCEAWEAAPTLHDLLARSDFVSVHCPLNEHTRGLIDADALRAMKPTAYLVNTARGGVINQAALVDALRANVIAGAGLDVQDPEPPEPDSPLWGLENATLSPHVGWKRVETRQRLMDAVAENVEAFLAGRPVNVVGGPGKKP